MPVVNLHKTKRQKKEYERMKKQLNKIDDWVNKHSHILRKNCNSNTLPIFQLYSHYKTKSIRLKKLLYIS